MSKSSDFLKRVLLIDAEGNKSKIINVRGHESGLDHTEITTQSTWEREEGIMTIHRIYSSEAIHTGIGWREEQPPSGTLVNPEVAKAAFAAIFAGQSNEEHKKAAQETDGYM